MEADSLAGAAKLEQREEIGSKVPREDVHQGDKPETWWGGGDEQETADLPHGSRERCNLSPLLGSFLQNVGKPSLRLFSF